MHGTQFLRTISYNLHFFRSQRGLSQTELAEKAGITVRTYQSMEAGKANPSLLTMNALAEALEVTASRLISLDMIRLDDPPERFLARFEKIFDAVKIAAGIRAHDGILLYRNKRFRQILSLPELSDGTVDLLEVLPLGSKEILRGQLASERNGMTSAYVNFGIDSKTHEKIYCRFYPCLIMPNKGRTPLFSAIYMTEVSEDCQKHYYDFCRLLLNSTKNH